MMSKTTTDTLNSSPTDSLVRDLETMFDSSHSADGKSINYVVLTTKLVVYINDRDRKIHEHAYKLGKESNGKDSPS